MDRHQRPSLAGLALASLLLLCAMASPAAAGEANYPPSDAKYHNYTEMVAEIKATAAAHPGIVRVFTIGKSTQGRQIWAAKVSDNVATDEAEPEVLVDSLHHGMEHLGLEQALYLLRTLSHDYTTDPSVKALVDSREIWIVFAVNPDGMQYDIAGFPHRLWRKNRQLTPGSRQIGTDLNRNYDYHWGCCGGSSGNPAATMYRGPRAFSAPETRVIRDFVASRVIDGRQQIRLHITLHTNGQLILWPYGYTKTDVPYDMTVDDHKAFVALGRGMAARNGYKPEQSSDLYITDGDEIDWMYGRYRIFSFTWELYPRDGTVAARRPYPPDEVIARETARNRSALLYAISAAACPYASIGKAQADCGPLFDDFEINRGWVRNPDGTDTATSGAWEIAKPAPVSSNGPKQLGTATSGAKDLVTGAQAGTTPSSRDLDGQTTMRSAPVQLPATVGQLSFSYYFAHAANATSDDWFRVWVEAQDGTRTLVLEELGTAANLNAAWKTARIDMTPWAGQSVRIVVGAADNGTDGLVEAGMDDLRIERP